LREIKVVPYNPTWQTEFEKAKAFYTKLLAGLDVQIEHVGSTSVIGLHAKPILDIDLIVPDSTMSEKVVKCLETVGYVHQGNMGIEGREAMKYDKDNNSFDWMEHHLYVILSGCESLENHMMLRRHLRNNPDAVKAYSQLKIDLAQAHTNDIDSYVEGKSELIRSFLEKEGMNVKALDRIESANKKDD
tara:strand:- start:220 stop:783 length:564 start_codon:yes stop_codon:yes gene_type:complete